MGCYNQRHYIVGICGDSQLDKDYLEKRLRPIIKKKCPENKPKIYFKKGKRGMELRVFSKRLFEDLKRLGFNPGKKSHTVRIPKQVLENKKHTRATIRGIFDTDGCLYIDRRKRYKVPYPRITLQSASIGLIGQIESFLSKDYKTYVNTQNRDGYRNYIEIYGHKQLGKFLKQIGFSNARHTSKYASVAQW